MDTAKLIGGLAGSQSSVAGVGGGGGGYSGEIKDEKNLSAKATSTTTTDAQSTNDNSGAAGNRGFIFTFNKGSGAVDNTGVGQGVNPLVKGNSAILLVAAGIAVVGLIVFFIVRGSKG